LTGNTERERHKKFFEKYFPLGIAEQLKEMLKFPEIRKLRFPILIMGILVGIPFAIMILLIIFTFPLLSFLVCQMLQKFSLKTLITFLFLLLYVIIIPCFILFIIVPKFARPRLLVKISPSLLLLIGLDFRFKFVSSELGVKYVKLFDQVADTVDFLIKRKPYHHVATEISQLRDQICRIKKILLLVPEEKLNRTYLAIKFSELALAFKALNEKEYQKGLPKIYSIAQELKKVAPYVSYERKISLSKKLISWIHPLLSLSELISIIRVLQHFLRFLYL